MKIQYINVFVSDLAVATRFYSEVLGLTLQFSSPQHRFAAFSAGGTRLGIAVPDAGQEGLVGRHTGVGFCVSDLTLEHSRMAALGVHFSMSPARQPWGGFMAMFEDPDRNVFYLDQDEPAPYERTPRSR